MQKIEIDITKLKERLLSCKGINNLFYRELIEKLSNEDLVESKEIYEMISYSCYVIENLLKENDYISNQLETCRKCNNFSE